MNEIRSRPSWSRSSRFGLLAFLLFVLAILAYKTYDEGWLLPRTPLDLENQPALLFFNRHKGCDCAVVVYNAAARQIREWPEAQRNGLKLITIDLDRRPDLGMQFKVVRAPSLLLLDAAGNIVYRQDDAVADLEPLNLQQLEQEIRKLSE